jgi:hypothetical protein
MVVAEGVAPPEDVDRMWQPFVGAGVPPVPSGCAYAPLRVRHHATAG